MSKTFVCQTGDRRMVWALVVLGVLGVAQTTLAYSARYKTRAREQLGITLASFPSVAAVNAYVEGNDLEAQAKRAVAFEHLRFGLYYMFTTRPAVERLRDAYRAAQRQIEQPYRTATGGYTEPYKSVRASYASRDSGSREAVLNHFVPGYATFDTAVNAARDAYEFTVALTVLGLVLFGASIVGGFFVLLVASWRDRRVIQGVTVTDQGDRVDITYRPGKHGPSAAFAVYAVYANVLLFGLTLLVPAIFLFVATENSGLWEWLDRNVPLNLTALRYTGIAAGVGLVGSPWWLLLLANWRRRKPRTLSVTPDGFVAVDGRTYERSMVREMYGWGIQEGDEAPRSTGDGGVVVPSNAAGRAAASGMMHRMAMQNSLGLVRRCLGRVGHEICIDYGEQRRVLANKLPKNRQHIVFDAADVASKRLHENG